MPAHFALLDCPFNLDDGTLAPTGLVRRSVVLQQYAATVDAKAS